MAVWFQPLYVEMRDNEEMGDLHQNYLETFP